MKVLAGLVLAVVMSVGVASAGEFDGVQPEKTSLVVLKDFFVKAAAAGNQGALKLKSKENGKECILRYPTAAKSYTIPAGSKFPLDIVMPEGSFPGYGLYVFFTVPGVWAEPTSAFWCQNGLSLTQIQNMLMEAGFELQDAL